MTDGSGSSGTDSGSTGSDGNRGTGAQMWWSDATNDPWRDPDAQAAIVTTRPTSPPPPPESELGHTQPPRRGTGFVAMLAVVSGLLAGAIGGAVGYVAATSSGAASAGMSIGSKEPPPAANRAPDSLPGLVARVMPSVVTVQGTVAQGESIGSGFVISSEGYVLTNEHVLAEVPDNAVRITLSDATTVLPAKVVGRDPESDLAVLKVDRKNLPAVQLGDSNAVAIGDGVLAIGAPLALSGTVTAGIVSALDRTIETRDVGGVQRYYAAIQTDAAVNRGNSGGPLFDYAGRVIGINSVIKSLVDQGEDAGNIGIAFAIPINQAARVATELIDTGKARRTVIGAELDTRTGSTGGVRLTRVDEGGPAANAGLQTGDVVTRIGNHPVVEPTDLIALVRRYDPGTVVTLVYRRGSATQSASVTLVADAN